MAIYRIYNGPSPTTAAQVAVTTAAVIKTLLQVAMGASIGGRIIEYGVSFNGSAAATPIEVELIETDVAATVTAHVTAGIVKLDAAALMGGDPVTNLIPVGTALTGYTATAEGATAVSRVFDAQFVAPTNQWVIQKPLGREWFMQVSKFTRIRVTAPAAVSALCYMDIEI